MSGAFPSVSNAPRLWRRLAASTFLAAPGFAMAGAASAQTIDYVALEQLFQEPVTASATGQPQRASEAPANMIIITADEIRKSGARDIPDVLRNVAGVDALEWTNGASDISLRGYGVPYAARVLVLVDGRQVYADHHGFMPWSALAVELGEIRQIEIVKGPNAALFGFNAVGGVINIVTRNPGVDKAHVESVSVGTQDSAQVSIVETFDLSEWLSVRLSGGAERKDEFSTPIPPGFIGARNDENTNSSIAVDAVADFSDKIRLKFGGSRADSSQSEITPGNDLAVADYTVTGLHASLEADSAFGLIEITGYSQVLDQQSPSALGDFDFHSELFVGRVQDVITLGASHTVRGFIEARTSDSTTSPFVGGRVGYDVASVGAMWNWRLFPNLALTNAVRFDRLSFQREGAAPAGYPLSNADWDRDIEETSFNSGLIWRPDDDNTVRIIAARGVQLPSLANAGAVLIATPLVNFTGSPRIEPTTTDDIQLDWRRAFMASGVQLHANLFWQDNKDIVGLSGDFVAGPGGFYGAPSNRGDSRAYGLELGLSNIGQGPWRWSVGYRLESIDDDSIATTIPISLASDNENTIPHHLVNARLGWTGGRWEIDGYLRYQSESGGLPPTTLGLQVIPLDDFATADARIAYALSDTVTLALSGQNLFTATQRQTAGPEVERRLMLTLSRAY
jgi:outer membrane receptor for ferrienterochelin and colicins